MDEENCSLLLKSISNGNKHLKLNDGSSFILGRNPETQIKDTRCSKTQLLLIPNFKNRDIVVEQTGTNPSAINGIKLQKGEKRKAYHNDIIEVLESNYQYKIVFSPCITEFSKKKKNTDLSLKLENNACEIKNETKINIKTHQTSLYSFLKDSALKSIGSWESKHDDSLIVFTSEGIANSTKIAAFDLDGTIITTVSGHVYPKDINDWKILFSNTVEKLKEVHTKGYKIVLFSNQRGLSKGKVKISDFKIKVEAIARKLAIPMQVFISTKDDIYRKPRVGMWSYFSENKNGHMKINFDESFYCGDAAGRPANIESNKNKKDFACSDRLFAMNLNLKFYTPEEYFLNRKPAIFKLPEFCPSSLLSINKPLLEPETVLTSKNLEIIVMVGCPGSGKSFFSKTYIVTAGYVYVNRDTLKTWQKCVTLTENSIKNNQSVIVDNTSLNKESRARYLNIGKKFNVPVRAFWMSTSLDHAKHNNMFRRLTDGTHDLITNHSIVSFSATIEPPVLEEGFSEIVRVNCVPHFKNEKDEELYMMYLLES